MPCYLPAVRLSDLIGQDAARTALLRAIGRGHLAHAYLFEGPPGIGKRGAALGLAMALNCAEARGAGCGVCEVCRRIEAGLHPDVPSFGPSGAGGQIVIEDAKAILALARTRPHEAAARVIVVDDADAMNPSSANCLLKTLEEPLQGNHLILCSSAPDRLLPTIRSRTQRIRFRSLDAPALLELGRARGVPAARAEIAAALADGSAARMLEAAAAGDDEEGGPAGSGGPAEALRGLRGAIATPGAAGVFDLAASLASQKDRDKDGDRDKGAKDGVPRLVGLLAGLYRDALAIAAGAPELAVLNSGAEAQALAAMGVDRLGRALAAIVDTQMALTANVNPTLAIERLAFALKRQEVRAA
jgi:DNA polymerase-3 subunit delta'